MQSIRRERFGEFSFLHRPGSGEAQVSVHFAHATGFNAETYRELFATLDPSLDVFAIDARGHGLTKATAIPEKLRSWSRYRQDLEGFIEALPRPTVLAGHSMGATVSIALAARRPELVEGLVLFDPVIVPPLHIPMLAVARALGLSQRLVPISQLAARRRMEFDSKEAAVENFVGKGAFRTWARTWIEAYVDGGTVPTDGGAVRLSCDRAWESRTFALPSSFPYLDIRRVRCPATVIGTARANPPFTKASQEAFKRCLPGARFLVLEDASHFIPMERPELAREEIERMADKVRSELR